MVGAIVVLNGSCVGQGYHHRIGMAHAEVEALQQAGARARGATLYVTLEPCSTYGRTPPCTEAVISAGITRVVIGTIDPNPMHAGRALDIFAARGIAVEVADDDACVELNEKFNHYIHSGIPFIHAKWAMTLDGKIATRTGESQWISCAASREYVHKLRSENDAVMVGIGTVLADDPLLNVRLEGDWRQPVKVVVDSMCRIPLSAKLLQDGVTIIACSAGADPEKVQALRETGAEIMMVSGPGSRRVDLRELINRLGAANISGLFVEGGGTLLGSLLDLQLVNRVTACISPKIIGGLKAPGPVGGNGIESIADIFELENISYETFEQDIMISGLVRYKNRHEPAAVASSPGAEIH
jgi:diaminohydroxyphosphoribosylaminopyrimidine deaminase/5-amino-6-(5-phosphoribosylamino)uracil reductase